MNYDKVFVFVDTVTGGVICAHHENGSVTPLVTPNPHIAMDMRKLAAQHTHLSGHEVHLVQFSQGMITQRIRKVQKDDVC